MDVSSQKSLNVLVVEDDINNAVVITRMLKLFGHSYTLAHNGREALKQVLENDFDLILMDLQMPEMDGVEAAKVIRNNKEYAEKANTPIIALTAHAMDQHRKKCVEAGMDDFITKPIIIDSIRQILEKYTGN